MSPRNVTLADIEAALRRRFAVTSADVEFFRSLVTAYAEAEGLALARARVLREQRDRRAELMAAGAPGSPIPAALRAAHAEVKHLLDTHRTVPPRLRELDRAYERANKRGQRERAVAGERAA